MPSPYVYPEIRSPYVGSLSDLMLRRGDIAARAAENIGQAWGGATQAAGQDVSAGIVRANDPRQQLEQQQVENNKRALAYQDTATKIAQSLVGPNGEQPSVDQATQMMTKAGIPLVNQKPILDSLESMATHHKEALADAGHVAYRIMNTLPAEATDDDRAHAASAGLGAAIAQGLVSPDQGQKITQALASGANPKGMALGFMGMSPSNRYKDVIQDETKPIVLAGAARPGGSPATLVNPAGQTIATGAPAGPEKPQLPTQASIAMEAAGGDPTKALGLLREPKTAPSLEEQYLTAKASGDEVKAKQILTTLRDTAQAKKDPTMTALAEDLAKLRREEAQAKLDDADVGSAKNQQKFEQQYRTVLQRGLSSRSGGLGLEDAKVQQANHLLALLEQTYDAKTDTYNIPKVLQGELAAGLARLVAPGGQVGIEMMREFNQRSAKGDLAGALSYVTGHPFPTATQDIAKMLKDSIERQGHVAETNREGEMAYLRGLAPTDLNEDRRKQLEAASLNPLRQSRLIRNKATGERRLQVSVDGGTTWR